ncbi:MHS family MFS transporter [Amycolatopsis sp. K13G38]|uniref:MHS family MFS transporter n=1 Tax=Amycolatopsis acididurans TaxID=2724524 RepID=A0ABX1J3E3_9PSEU|nr:MFS transporter [Amycolatopsis acididurans]NKQ54302.1 MHS family MFS transporter [Amycolatopsis acididurans]
MNLRTGRSEAVTPTTARTPSVNPLRAAVAGGLGSLIEYFDFAIYGFVAVYIAGHFFPNDRPAVGVLATMGAFTIGYVVRPIGGWFFGRMGDRRGRSKALVVTVVAMGVCTTAIGLLPSYATIGILAPIALLALRIVQGFCAGGEAAGAASYAAESAPPGRRGLYTSLTPMGTTGGYAVAAIVVGVVTMTLSSAQMQSWGWRIPFLVVAPITLVCAFFRLKLEDSPEFLEMASRQVAKSPLKQVVSQHPVRVLQAALLTFATFGTSTLVLTYFPTFFIKTRGINANSFYWMMAVVIFLALLLFPFIGSLSDRFGRKRVMLAGYCGLVVLAYPLFWSFENARSLVVIGLVFLVYYLVNGTTIAAAFLVTVELMPRAVRYTGAALGINLGLIAVGFGPTVAADLVSHLGSITPIALWPAICGVVGAATLLLGMRETAGAELPK